MSCILKLSVAKTPYGGEVYLVDPDQHSGSITDRRLSRNPRERAAAEAEDILANARAEAEKICLEALERGYKEGSEQAAAEYAQIKREAEQLIEAVGEERDAFFARIEPKVVKLTVEIAEKILRQELATRPELVLDTVRFALTQLRDAESIKLFVNPEDVELVKDDDRARQADIIADRRVERGGCVAESPAGRIDANIKTQISQVNRLFEEAASDNAGSADAGPEQIQQDS